MTFPYPPEPAATAANPFVKLADMQSAATKATPVDADGVIIIDSAASNAIKRTLWSAVKATLKTYFDTLYFGTSFTKAQLDAAVSDDNVAYLGQSQTFVGNQTVTGNITASGTGTFQSTGAHTFGTTNTVTITDGALKCFDGSNAYVRLGRFASDFGGISFGPDAATSSTVAMWGNANNTSVVLNTADILYFRRQNGTVIQLGSTGIDVTGNITATGSIKPGIKTIATLPSAASSTGERHQLSDSATIVNRVAFSNGTAWYYEGTAAAV